MSQIVIDIIGISALVFIWLPLLSGICAVITIFVIDAIREKELKEDFKNKLPYVYRQVIDSYNSQRYLFFKKQGHDCFILKNSEEFKKYEENAKEFVDTEL